MTGMGGVLQRRVGNNTSLGDGAWGGGAGVGSGRGRVCQCLRMKVDWEPDEGGKGGAVPWDEGRGLVIWKFCVSSLHISSVDFRTGG